MMMSNGDVVNNVKGFILDQVNSIPPNKAKNKMERNK
jgi:hypothetical protein